MTKLRDDIGDIRRNRRLGLDEPIKPARIKFMPHRPAGQGRAGKFIFRCDLEWLEDLKQRAEKARLTTSNYIRLAVDDFIKREDEKLQKPEG